MTSITNVFSDSSSSSSEKILRKIKNGEWIDIMNGVCNIKDNLIILDHNYFKYFATKETYNIILSRVINNINEILLLNDGFVVHINMKGLTVTDIDKHLSFIKSVSTLLKETYPNKLTKCFIHNPPFVLAQILNIVSLFIDKETLSKIELVSTK